jgi:hypothetical protein
MISVVGSFGWLDRRATLAHELYWNCDCLEAPRPSAADSLRQFPSVCEHHARSSDECVFVATRSTGS